MIINHGTIGQPFYHWEKHHANRCAQYAILDIDEKGITEVSFKRISYDIEKEWKNAMQHKLPYVDLFQEMLETGNTYALDTEYLQKLYDKFHYKEEIINFFGKNYW